MKNIDPKDYKAKFVELAQKWRVQLISDEEFNTLNSWYYALSGETLGQPDGPNVEKLESWIHKMCFSPQPTDPVKLQELWDAMKRDKSN
jgi:hypothetical protein